MLYIFTIKERVLGGCDYEHLKENTEKIWNESRETTSAFSKFVN